MSKAIPLFLVAGILVAAFVFARSVIGLLMDASGPPEARQASPAKGPVGFAVPPGRELVAYGDILRLNPFGEGPAGELVPLGTAPARPDATPVQSAAPGAPFELAGVIVKRDGYRFAVFEREGAAPDAGQILAREGDTVPGIGRVARIDPRSVDVETPQGTREIAVRDVGALLGKTSAKATGYPRKAQRKLRKPSARQGQIQQIDDGTFRLSKEGIQAALKNPQQIMTEARMLPYMEDGGQKGFIVREVKKGGIYEGLGLANGDILLRVNDLSLESPDSALQAFGALQGVDKIQLEIVRRGENRTLVYHIE